MVIIGADDHPKYIVKAEGSVNVVPAKGLAESNGGTAVEEIVNGLPSVTEGPVRNSELLRIPDVNASLIANLNLNPKVCKSCRATADNSILSLPTEIIEVAV